MEPDEQIENIRVFIRVRPLNAKELFKGYTKIISYGDSQNTLFINNFDNKSTSLRFDRIFTEISTQGELYKTIASPIVYKAFEGYNGTIFTYGQTGSGKTYTMSNTSTESEKNGLIPHAFNHIFGQISNTSSKEIFILSVTYLEIYNEQLRDLLAPEGKHKLELREHKVSGPYVANLKECTVKSSDELMQTFNTGTKNRATRSTELNEVSSRSHAIFTISIEKSNKKTGNTTIGKLNFVDLAGSERAARTKASGDCLREACNINLSLMVLGNVISALVDGKSTYVPYRNSKLTRLLQNSLGGNSKTAMIAMISPCELDTEETKCTLHYATRVKSIKNKTYKNVGYGHIQGYEAEIRELREKVAALSALEDFAANKPCPNRKLQNRIRSDNEKYDEEIKNNQKIKDELLEKIACIQEKLIVGGENMYHKVQLQTQLLETTETEIEELNKTNQELEDTLIAIGNEKTDVEDQYANLQDEDNGISQKIEKVQNLLAKARSRYACEEHEQQKEIEGLCDSNRMLISQLQLTKLIMDKCIPKETQEVINSKISWDDENNEFCLDKIAFASNNVKKKSPRNRVKTTFKLDRGVQNPYKKYSSEVEQERENVNLDPILNVSTYDEFVAHISPNHRKPLLRRRKK